MQIAINADFSHYPGIDTSGLLAVGWSERNKTLVGCHRPEWLVPILNSVKCGLIEVYHESLALQMFKRLWMWFNRWVWKPVGQLLRVRELLQVFGLSDKWSAAWRVPMAVLTSVALASWAAIENYPWPLITLFLVVALPFAFVTLKRIAPVHPHANVAGAVSSTGTLPADVEHETFIWKGQTTP